MIARHRCAGLALGAALASSILASSVLAPAAQAGSRPWTRDDILALKTVSDPQVSPDGRWVAYVVSELNLDQSEYQTDIWLVPTAGGEARRLTRSNLPDEYPRWSPDGKTIAFISERPKPGAKPADAPKPGDPNADEGKRQIWLIQPDGGEAWMFSDSKGSVSALEWSRDGKCIAYLAREPKTEERRKKEKEKDDAWTPSQMYPWTRLWVTDVASRKATQLTGGELHVTGFSLAPDGKRIVIAGQPTPLLPDNFNSDLYLVSITGGRPTPLVKRVGADTGPAWSPDGQWIAFVSQDGRSREWYTNNYVCVVAPSGGEPRNLTRDFDERASGLGGGPLVWSPDAQYVAFQANQRTALHLLRASPHGGPVEPLTRGPEVNTALSYDAKRTMAVFLREDDTHPREVYRVSIPGGAPEPLTDTNPQVRDLLPLRRELVSWKGADGWDMDGLLILPVGYRPGQRVPLILNVHGGPAGAHANTFAAANKVYGWPLFAQKGYAILFPNPRGSGGYGAAFRAANVRDWGGKDYQDLMMGVDALIERGLADRNRLAVCGWSYGGFMTSTIVTKTDRFRAAVVGAGVTDLVSMAGTCDIPDFNRSYFDSWPWEDPTFYVEHSALLHAGNVRTPTLMVHGQADERVPTSQGWEFYTALRKTGVPTDLLLLPRQPHGPREPRLLRSCLEWHFDWINRYTLSALPVLRSGVREGAATTGLKHE